MADPITHLRTRHIMLTAAILSLGSAAVPACGSNFGDATSADAGNGGAQGGVGTTGFNVRDAGALGGTQGAGGAPSAGGTPSVGSSCTLNGQSCTHPDQCCSTACVDSVCVDFGVCSPSGTECSSATACCSGRCEPVTGQAGLRQCANYCLRDGQSCTKAQDCCSLGCFGGKCGGGLCIVEGQPCTENAECCSNICDPNKRECAIDQANTDCRPTGEDCNSGSGSGCCEVCNEQTRRCDFGPGTCRPQGVGCTTDTDCCKGKCLTNANGQLTCQIPCLPDGNSACTMNAECCSFDCNGAPAHCGPPATGVGGGPGTSLCTPTGNACAINGDCCSGFCLSGICDLRCRLDTDTCTGNADCCSGLCSNGTCAPVVILL